MVGDSNKILTVSYGTFSCTLEGFDDPFNSMREIAEYFRDLAADDRYFGAEPPTPDPERLHLIAQSNTSRAVTAKVGNDGAVALQQAEPPKAADPAPEPISETDQHAEDAQPTLEPDDLTAGVAGHGNWKLDDPAPEPDEKDDYEDTQEPVSDDSVLDRLARIRAATGLDTSVAVNKPTAGEEEVVDNEDTADLIGPDAVSSSLQAAFSDVEPDAVTDAPMADTPAAEAQAEEPAATPPRPKPALLDVDDAAHQSAMEAAALADEPQTPVAAPQTDTPVADPDEPATAAAQDEDEDEVAELLKSAPIDADAGDGSADRIFREADSQLGDTEARRRRSAIAHLKAAVSATVADRNILGWRDRRNEEERDAYRQDLADAVRPMPNAAGETEPTAPRADNTHKLGSVADIDDEEDEPLVLGGAARIEPLSLESGARVAQPSAASVESFADFADRVGAVELGDLLEAAAAYTGQVEGIPEFSRPQIMRHVQHALSHNYTREDGLRSFGILLRQGKIRKLKRGVFVLSEGSRYGEGNLLAGE